MTEEMAIGIVFAVGVSFIVGVITGITIIGAKLSEKQNQKL